VPKRAIPSADATNKKYVLAASTLNSTGRPDRLAYDVRSRPRTDWRSSMKLLEAGDVALPPSPPTEPVRLVSLRGRRPPSVRPYDDLRELTVVVWARTKLIERRLDGRGPVDPNLRASLADIEAAVAAIGVRLDALEDALPRRAA
jgi:hypothetical protein